MSTQIGIQDRGGQSSASIAQWINALVVRQPPEHSLLQEFYSDPGLYRFEIDHVLMKHWHCVGHVSQIPERGQFILFEFENE